MSTAGEVARLLAQFDDRLKALERAPRLKNASMHDTVIPVYDDGFTLRQTVGRQPDGTYTVVDSNGPPPPVPSQPLLEARPGTLVVTWDGLFAAGAAAPADWDHVEVHVSTTSGYTPTDATQVATFNTLKGGSVTLALDPVAQYVVFQAVSTSRTESAPTGEVPGTPLPPTTGEGGVQTFREDDPPVGLDASDDGALWYDTNDGNHPYRWDGGTLAWVSIRDASIATAAAAASAAQTQANSALTAAQAAQATADGSIRTFYQSAAPWANGSSQPAEVVGDLWFDTDDGQAYRWNGTTWVIIEDNSIAAALAAAQNAQTTADGKITSYYQTTIPVVGELGDLWYDTDDQNKPYYCSSVTPLTWTSIRDGKIADAQATANAALDAATTDGIAPTASPDPTALSGIETIEVRWTPITNPDPVRYAVHISTTLGFTPDSTTLVGDTSASSFWIKSLPGAEPGPGDPDLRKLQYDTAYYIRVVASDADGAAPASLQAIGSVFQVTGINLAVDSVTAANILAGSLTGELFSASVVVAGTFKSGETGQRVEWGVAGIQGYRSDGSLILNIPTDGSTALFDGEFIIRGATITGGISIQNDQNEVTANGAVTLMRGIVGPSATPAVTVVWDQVRMSTTSLTDAQKTDNGADWGLGGPFDFDASAVSNIEWKPSESMWIMQQIRSNGTRAWFFNPDGTPKDRFGNGKYFADTKNWEIWGAVEIPAPAAKAGVYTIFRYLPSNTQWYVNGPNGFNTYTRLNSGGTPTLGTNGIDFFIAENVSGSHLKINYHSMAADGSALPAPSTSYEALAGFAASPCSVQYSSTGFDIGTARYSAAQRGVSYNARLMSLSGTTLIPGASGGWASSTAEAESWESPTTNRRGMGWDGTNFYTLGGDGVLYKHTGERWDPSVTPSNVYHGVTFKDTDAGGTGTHETKMGPLKLTTHKRRAKLQLVAPAVPDNGGNDDPDKIQWYAGRSAATPISPYSAMWAQSSPIGGITGPASLQITTLATTGTNPPITNTFPSANAAKIRDDDDTMVIDGNGKGLFKQFQVGAAGSTANAMKWGAASTTVINTSGQAIFTHNLGTTPSVVLLGQTGWYMRVQGQTATTFTCECRVASTNALVANGISVNVNYLVIA